LGAAEIAYRAARYEDGLGRANRALQLDAYDAGANFLAGTLYRAMGRVADARDAFGWAARSTAYRSAAYAQLSELMIGEEELREAARYARLAIEFDRHSVPGWRALAVVGRRTGDQGLAQEARAELLALDPLHHFVLAEGVLAERSPGSAATLAAALGGEYPDQTLLELALHYVGIGRTEDATALLELETPLNEGPVHQAWRAYLRRDVSLLADPGAVEFQFPFRTETLGALAWAAERHDSWMWDYLLGLNLWGVGRVEEGASLLRDLGDRPDWAPFYVARALLPISGGGAGATADLRRAVTLDPGQRVLHVYLVRHLQDEGRWPESLEALTGARDRFPVDFNLALLQAKSLLHVGRAEEATTLLGQIRVLPSENARESHHLYAQAHTLVAMNALDGGDPHGAREHLDAALAWPESLGQGKPYEPEERMVRYLTGRVGERLGDDEARRASYQAVVDATPSVQGGDEAGGITLEDPLDLLAINALAGLGRIADLRALADELDAATEGDGGSLLRYGALLARALATGVDPATTAAALASGYPDLFDDLEGGMVLRALSSR
jgi:tetratricopeptide (TPR) repeat protein